MAFNWAYIDLTSLAFGFLSGNSNIVRLSSKESDSALLIVKILSKLLSIKKYSEIKKFISIIQFDHDDEVNKFWMSIADARVIWGGNQTVSKMRTFQCKPRSREIVFPDRFSLCVINANKIVEIWRFVNYISSDMPVTEFKESELTKAILDLQADVKHMKNTYTPH